MPNLSISVPHQLTRPEAKRRVEEGITQLRNQYGGTVSRLEERWEGDTLHFSVSVMGFTIPGQVFIEDAAVRIEVVLPMLAALFGGEIKQRIEQEGRKLLRSG